MMAAAQELEGDAGIGPTLAHQALAEAELVHEIDHPVFEHAGADRAFDIGAAAILEDDAVDAGASQQMREEEPGGSRADDTDLRAHIRLPCSSRDLPRKGRGLAESKPLLWRGTRSFRPAIVALGAASYDRQEERKPSGGRVCRERTGSAPGPTASSRSIKAGSAIRLCA